MQVNSSTDFFFFFLVQFSTFYYNSNKNSRGFIGTRVQLDKVPKTKVYQQKYIRNTRPKKENKEVESNLLTSDPIIWNA